MKRTIKLSESVLHDIISESVKMVLSEVKLSSWGKEWCERMECQIDEYRRELSDVEKRLERNKYYREWSDNKVAADGKRQSVDNLAWQWIHRSEMEGLLHRKKQLESSIVRCMKSLKDVKEGNGGSNFGLYSE